MNNYYRAIGFGRGYLKPVLKNIINKAIDDYKRNNSDNSIGRIIEIFVHFDRLIGLTIHGEFNEKGEFEVEYTFPYLVNKFYEKYDDIIFERSIYSYSFKCGIDNKNTGGTIIFYLQNSLDYVNNKFPEKLSAYVGLSALSLSGKIILPGKENLIYKEIADKIEDDKRKMIVKAQNGDEAAIENLTLGEMDLYSRLSKRLENEDVLSVVDTCFMPYGMECDRYSIIGKILEVRVNVNRITNEKVYILALECNNTKLNVAINEDDLIGEPKKGRRFKGNIWLQGHVFFSEKELLEFKKFIQDYNK